MSEVDNASNPRIEQLRSDYATFTAHFNQALQRVEWRYFLLPVAGQTHDTIRERAFCYELYHQMRIVFCEHGFGYNVGGEINKSGHPKIRVRVSPDLVVHQEDTMDWNLCAIEVKPISGRTSGFEKDVRTLRRFASEYYYRCILLVYGNRPDPGATIRTKLGIDFAQLALDGIETYWIAGQGAEVVTMK